MSYIARCLPSFVLIAGFLIHTASQSQAQPKVRWELLASPEENAENKTLLQELERPSPRWKGNKSLREVLQMLPVPVYVDDKSLEEESVTDEEPICGDYFPIVSTRVFLDLMLHPLHLDWTPKGKFIRISAIQMEANIVGIYDVTSLIHIMNQKSSVAKPTKQSIDSFHPIHPVAALVNTIQTTIHPDAWQASGGSASMMELPVGKKTFMVFSAPFRTHTAVQDFFSSVASLDGREPTITKANCALDLARSRFTDSSGRTTCTSPRSSRQSSVRKSQLKQPL
jgi:hypothetical protein